MAIFKGTYWTSRWEDWCELRLLITRIGATTRPDAVVSTALEDGTSTKTHHADLVADTFGVAWGNTVLFIAVGIGNDVRELAVGLGEEVIVVLQVRLVLVLGRVGLEQGWDEWWRATCDELAYWQAVDETDDVLDVEVGFAVLFGDGVLVVHSAVDEG